MYAGGGSSLFQRRLLLEIMGRGEPYHPFYWEDVEWGVEAWKRGYECLFCPKSTVRHTHRATVAKFYEPGKVERIFRRNACQFQLRNLETLGSPRALCRRMLGLDHESSRTVASPRNLAAALLRRVRAARFPFDDRGLAYVRHQYYFSPPAAAATKPVLLVASPFALFPPAHGGAVRLNELLGRLAGSFSVILLSDEAGVYGRESLPYFKKLSSVHLIEGRLETNGDDRARIAAHSHHGMQEALERLAACWRPAVVQIEYMELAGLRRPRGCRAPWLLTPHDAPLPRPGARALIRRFDRVLVCSAEDEKLLGGERCALISNGGRVNQERYVPSPDSGVLLCAGAFRYRPNLDELRVFLEKVYPRLKEDFPAAELWVLGGRDAVRTAEGIDAFPDDHVFHDYRRTRTDGTLLERTKTIQRQREGRVSVIRRTYRFLSPDGTLLRSFTAEDRIRCFRRGELPVLLRNHGFNVVEESGDSSARVFVCRSLSEHG